MHPRRFGLFGALAALVLFATMDTLCGPPWPYYESIPLHRIPPLLDCQSWSGNDTEGCGPLCAPAFWNDATVSEVLPELTDDVDVEQRNVKGYSPLHLAARCSADPDVITLLIVAGADPNQEGRDNVRPLHIAAEYADAAIVQRLLDGGADVNARTDRDLTALHLAAWADQAQSVRVLISGGADIERLDGIGHTPLQVAAWRANLDALSALLDAGAEVNTRGHDGWTALHHAVYDSPPYKSFETNPDAAGTLLLERGANPRLRTDDGRSAFEMTREQLRGSTLQTQLCIRAR